MGLEPLARRLDRASRLSLVELREAHIRRRIGHLLAEEDFSQRFAAQRRRTSSDMRMQ
jgi:hypothetical protein